MTWMNECEIDEAVRRHARHPVLGRAARILRAYADEVNSHSDGWPYWRGGYKPASKLMDMLLFRNNGAVNTTASEADLRRALTPIKSACTRHGMTFPTHIAEEVRS